MSLSLKSAWHDGASDGGYSMERFENQLNILDVEKKGVASGLKHHPGSVVV